MTAPIAPGAQATCNTFAQKASRLRWWYIAAPLLIVVIVGQLNKLAIPVVMSHKQFLHDLNLLGRPAVTGLLTSGFLFSYAICQFVWGYTVRRFGPRVSAITGVLICGGAMLLSGIAETASALITARIILGIGGAFMFPVASTFVANWFPVSERGRANSIWLSGMTVGPAICGVLVVVVMAAGGWRTVFFTLAALSLLPLSLAIFLMRDHPLQQARISSDEVRLIEEGVLAKTKEVPHTTVLQRKGGYLADYHFWLVTLACGFNHIYFWGWSTWMPTYFQDVHHLSFHSAGYLFSLSFLFTIPAMLVVGYCSDRTMRRAPFGAGCWIIAGILMFVGGGLLQNAYWALAVLTISLCCQEAAFLMGQSLLQSLIPESLMGSAMGISAGVSMLMSAISPTLIGFLLQISGFGSVIVFLALALLIPGILTLFLVREGY